MPAQSTALRLLIAVDGSEHANGALRLVAALARRGARLHAVLLNVQKPVMSGEVGVIAPASVTLETRDRAAAEVLEAASRVLAEADVTHDRLEEIEDAGVAIAAVAATQGCDAIVVGSRGLGRLRAALLGSVSTEVIRRADRPVIIVGTPDPVLPEGALRILAAVDGSEGSTRALSFAAAFGRALPAQELHLLHVQQPLSLVEAMLGPRERLIEHWSAADDESVFAGARALLEGRGYEYSMRFVQEYVPAEAIARIAEELRCGMIALGTRGLAPMAGLLLGSVAQGVLQRVRIPVILSR